jgi:hypothetical protein
MPLSKNIFYIFKGMFPKNKNAPCFLKTRSASFSETQFRHPDYEEKIFTPSVRDSDPFLQKCSRTCRQKAASPSVGNLTLPRNY